MKKFNYSELLTIAGVIKQECLGLFLQRAYSLSQRDFYFSLSRKYYGLFISLNNQTPFIDVTNTSLLLSKIKIESHLNTIIQHHLDKAKLIDVDVVEGQKIIVLTFEKHYENFRQHQYKVYIELVVAHPNLIIVDETGHIVSVYRPSKDFSGARILRIGQPYVLPKMIKPFQQQESNLVAGDMSRAYLRSQKEAIKKANHKDLYHYLKSSIKRLKLKKAKIERELAALVDTKSAMLYGQLLLTYQPDIKTTPIHLDEVNIEVDPGETAITNANMWFAIGKKAKQTRENKLAQLTLIDEELTYLNNIVDLLPNYTEDELVEIEIELGIGVKQYKQKNQAPSFKPYYVIFDGVKIGFGRNNLQNDYLTFKAAHKNHTFMHIQGQPGPHLVIFHEHPHHSIIEFAAKLGLHLSKVPSASFSIALRKNIKKGNFPGSVILDKTSSIYVNEDISLISDYLDNIKRF